MHLRVNIKFFCHGKCWINWSNAISHDAILAFMCTTGALCSTSGNKLYKRRQNTKIEWLLGSFSYFPPCALLLFLRPRVCPLCFSRDRKHVANFTRTKIILVLGRKQMVWRVLTVITCGHDNKLSENDLLIRKPVWFICYVRWEMIDRVSSNQHVINVSFRHHLFSWGDFY